MTGCTSSGVLGAKSNQETADDDHDEPLNTQKRFQIKNFGWYKVTPGICKSVRSKFSFGDFTDAHGSIRHKILTGHYSAQDCSQNKHQIPYLIFPVKP